MIMEQPKIIGETGQFTVSGHQNWEPGGTDCVFYFWPSLRHCLEVVSSPSQTLYVSKAIVQKAVNGDRNAQHEILRVHTEFIRGMLFRLAGRSDELDDLFQNVCVEVMQSIARFRGESEVSTWIGSICVNVTKANFHKRKRERNIALALNGIATVGQQNAQSNSVSSMNASLRLQRVEKTLSRLSDNQRIVFILKVAYGYSIKEIAKLTKSAQSTTRMRLYYARKNFAKAMKRDRDSQEAGLVPKMEEG